MKMYKAVFSSQSVINEIPNSQTLFGAFCTILLQTEGKEAFNRYIESLQGKEALFVHSSMMLNHTFPMIKRNVFSVDMINSMVSTTSSNQKLHVLENVKKYKKIKYMSEGVFQKYLLTDHLDTLKTDVLNQEESFSLENGILSLKDESLNTQLNSIILTRNGFSENGKDKTLFYSQAHYFPKGTEFCIFLRSNESEEYLERIMKYLEFFGIGNRKSIGVNVFHFERLENVQQHTHSSFRFLLSRYIPNKDEIDFNLSYYKLNSNVYRASKEYAAGYVSGKFVHILEGSWLKVKEEKEYYGRIIKTLADDKEVYHYGIGFVV